MPGRTVLVSGASGLVGSAVVPALERAGHRVLRLVRRDPVGPNEIPWDPAAHRFDPRHLDGVDTIVNLAGENIGQRWTTGRRRRIRESRVAGTDALVAAIGAAPKPPTLINASAVGFYGDRGDDVLTESSDRGSGFLAEICRQWEQSANLARTFGGRVVTMRSGIVLDPKGGALGKMLLPFRLGIGGRLGSGRQWMSWILLADLVRAIEWIVDHPTIDGPVNATAPNPAPNREFARALGKALHRPAIFPLPGFVLKLIFGEMAEETMLRGQRVVPKVLIDSGFEFSAPTLAEAFARIL